MTTNKLERNEQIFKYLNPNDNDKLSKLNGYDLQDMIILINDLYIKLRNQLELDKKITFGLELEFENAKIETIEEQVEEKLLFDWDLHSDGTLVDGAEISSPILKDTTKNWNDLNTICSIVKQNAEIGSNSGGHIHIGAQVLNNERESLLNFIKIWSVYENIIFRFAYGNYLTGRKSILKYAKPISKSFLKIYENAKEDDIRIKKIIYKLADDRYKAVNFENVDSLSEYDAYNTIEFRSPNGSLDAVIWQNNVNLFVKLLCYANNSNYNEDIINKRYKLYESIYNQLNLYDEIYLEQALELCDMIFSNNYDKIYFLKQYLKSFQVYNKEKDNKVCVLTKK